MGEEMKFDNLVSKITQSTYSLKALEELTKPNILVEMMIKSSRSVKVTWKDKIKWFFEDWKYRFSLAFDVLLGRHECNQDY